ncbi:MAG: alpha/beta hydrolase [Proteobacteria bacterium]|nr:alpha/beta hydrolase [Pseudomonadota bacterium]
MAGPGIGGLIEVLGTLRGPLEFEPIAPTHIGLAYAARGRRRHSAPRADVYLPEGHGPHPGVLLVHGGGFIIGGRSMKPMRRLTTGLVKAGYAVASIDYRKIGRGGSRLRGVEDVEAALAWWFAQSSRFGLDPDRMGAVGLSAGATLLMLASERPSSGTLRSRVSVFGLYDFGGLQGTLAGALRTLLLRGQDSGAVSPRRKVRSEVPITMLHGTGDQLVPIAQAREFALSRRAAGLSVELHELDGAPHGFFNQPGPYAEQGLRILLETLDRDLGATSP